MTSDRRACADGLEQARDYLWRARRAGTRPGEGSWSETYTWVFALALAVPLLANACGQLVGAQSCTGTGCRHGGGVAGLTGLVLGPPVATTAGVALLDPASLSAAPLGAALALLALALVARAQPDPRLRRGVVHLAPALGWAGVLVGAFSLPDDGRGASWVLPGALDPRAAAETAAVSALVGLVGVLLLRAADRRVEDVDGAELRRAGDTATAAVGAVLMLDASGLAQRAERDRLGSTGRRRSRPGRGTGPWALLVLDLRRIGRRRDRWVLGIPLLLACLLLAALAPAPVTVAALGVAALWLARSLADGLTAWTRSSGLRRELPWPDATLRATYLVGPVLVALLWCTLAVLLLGLAWWVLGALVLTAAAGLLAGAREIDPPS